MAKLRNIDWQQQLAEDDCGLYGHQWEDFVFFSKCKRCGHKEENQDEEEDNDVNKIVYEECETLGHIWEDNYDSAECIRCGTRIDAGDWQYCEIFGHNWEDFEDTCKCSNCGLIME